MSGFERFITYINLYEKNKKIRNIGFAKIEKRGGQCKIEIHMRGTGYTAIACPAYLYVRENDLMKGIAIGKIQMQNGNGDYQIMLEEDDIDQTGYGIEDTGGLLVFVSDAVMFASQWDNKEIRRERFIPLKAENKEDKKPKTEIKSKMESKPNSNQAGLQNKHKPEEQKKEMAKEMPKNPVKEMPKEPVQKTPNPITNSIKAAEAMPQLKVIPQSQPTQKEQDWEEKWQFILENYPVLTPFEGEEEILCVRLELKDMRILPKRYWYLGNNSFLLHGFFNYRYLILGAMEQEGKKQWFIGVPGVFQSQEKVMAAIFGFPEYKNEKTQSQKTGQFGYWYRFMDE